LSRAWALTALALIGCGHSVSSRSGEPSPPDQHPPAVPAREAPAQSGEEGEGPPPSATPTAVKPRPTKIRIVVRVNAPHATVRWGKKALGEAPVTLERPRDSGPVDLVVSAEGYFPVHTRAYTFRNEPLLVRMTKVADRMTLLGAKAEPPPETAGDPGGLAPPAADTATAKQPPAAAPPDELPAPPR
jgi:hypothetical protein